MTIGEPNSDYLETYYKDRINGLAYYLKSIEELVRKIGKQFGQALEIGIDEVFKLLDEISRFNDKFIQQIDKKIQRDNKTMEQVYKEQLLKYQANLG